MKITMPNTPKVAVRPATLTDTVPLMQIYNREVLGSRVTLDLVPRTIETQTKWIEEHLGPYPALVATISEQVVGFASVSPYRVRPGYSTTVEDSIYIDPNFQGRGIGKLLLSNIVGLAAKHGFHACMARVASDHTASLALHKSIGFFEVGLEREVGRKFGKWIDMMLLELLLKPQ
ncbi:N-acyltransferase YncA [Acidithrix ferrooxidans]|uniref:N-acyltransferase YncA n=2 Tax=Acidimicrobiaceae TaxID=84994 RepID=A0A0D8HKZ5_9ACTN|nr:N-acyltransferase YncA [Acidithrix ferrooxidans]